MIQQKHFHFKKLNGGVLSHVQVHLMFWGSHWDKNGAHTTMERVKLAARKIMSDAPASGAPGDGAYLSQLAQYNGKKPIHVEPGREFQVPQPDPPSTFSEQDVIAAIKTHLGGKATAPSRQLAQLYLVFLPPGVEPKCANPKIEELDGKHCSFTLNGKKIFYAWIRSTDVGDPVPRITVTLSEELVETITHPDKHSGYVTVGNRELCDVCEGLTWYIPGKHGKRGKHGKHKVLVHAYYSEEKDNSFPGPDNH